ncbi:MAG: hypothetical protein FWD57_08140, partial [Polyangiaceae bacterium]|nr:hypothetical protein [Polyangiaceae bacterium]
WRTICTSRTAREPPDAERHVRWCGGWGDGNAPWLPDTLGFVVFGRWDWGAMNRSRMLWDSLVLDVGGGGCLAWVLFGGFVLFCLAFGVLYWACAVIADDGGLL